MEEFFSDLIYFLPFAGLIFYRILLTRRRKKDEKTAKVQARGTVRGSADAKPARTRMRRMFLKAEPYSVREVEISSVVDRIIRKPVPEQVPSSSGQARRPQPADSLLSSSPIYNKDMKNAGPAPVFSRKIDALPPLKKALVTAEILARPRGW